MNLAYNECWRQKDKLERKLKKAENFATDKVQLCLHLTEQNNNLEKENANLKKLIYKCKSLMHARSSFEAYEIWEEVEKQLRSKANE